jgi:hypothetical protein
MMHMEVRNRDSETGRGHESSFSLTRQAQTNHYDRRIRIRESEHHRRQLLIEKDLQLFALSPSSVKVLGARIACS